MKKITTVFILLTLSFSIFAGVGDSNFDHSSWDKLLQKHVSVKGNVNYDGFKADKQVLDAYLTSLSKNSPASNWSKNDVMAYWINAYNAFTVKLILNNYPVKSIMDINGGKAWDLKFIKLGGKEYSLNNIEHGILRKRYKDARIHFAVNCASVSCPKLANSAFTAADLEKQLEKMSKEFIDNSSKNTVQTNELKISSLFDWYKDDFITSGGSVISFINRYSNIKASQGSNVSFKEYNWNLNK
ncbi:MAG: DUF547 domain-containing protein [Flavobacteriales bacterium]|nr:DUF547 domain-containing protein [Flavobacteriales bacterium]